MADNKKYYYLKLKENFFDDDEIKILEAMPNGHMYSNLLLKLYLKSLKYDGALKFNDFIPYNEEMIAAITNLNIDIVRSGLVILSQMKLIEKLDNGTMYMLNIQQYIGKSSTEADRKRVYRQEIEQKKLGLEHSELLEKGQMSDKCPDTSGTETDECSRERETRDKRLEIRDKREREDIVNQSVNLLSYFENTTGKIGTLNFGTLKVSVSQHGYEHVKKAIDKALEANKPTMVYINGILKNWAKEGYPKDAKKKGAKIDGSSKRSVEDELREQGIGL